MLQRKKKFEILINNFDKVWHLVPSKISKINQINFVTGQFRILVKFWELEFVIYSNSIKDSR